MLLVEGVLPHTLETVSDLHPTPDKPMSRVTYLLGQLVFSKLSEPAQNLAGLTLCTCWLVPSSCLGCIFSPQGCSSPLPQNFKPETAPSISVLKFMKLSSTLLTSDLTVDTVLASLTSFLLTSPAFTSINHYQGLSRTLWLCSDHHLTGLLFCSESCGLNHAPSSRGHKPPLTNPVPSSVPSFCSGPGSCLYCLTTISLLLFKGLCTRLFLDILTTGSCHHLAGLGCYLFRVVSSS